MLFRKGIRANKQEYIYARFRKVVIAVLWSKPPGVSSMLISQVKKIESVMPQ